MAPTATIESVKTFWEANPLCAAAIPHPLGSRAYFAAYDALREKNESPAFSADLHEYSQFKGRKVLDVGCGNGYVLARYAQAGAEVYGVDLTEQGVQLCRRRFEFAGLQGDFRVANAEELPFPDNHFDCVCSMGVLHHTPNTPAAVAQIHRVLKPGGRLIIMMYHRNSALYRVAFRYRSRVTGKSIGQLVDEVDGIGNPKGDVYSRAELADLLRNFAGLKMFCGQLEGGHILPRGGRLIPRGLIRLLERRWGWFLYAKGWKPPAPPRNPD